MFKSWRSTPLTALLTGFVLLMAACGASEPSGSLSEADRTGAEPAKEDAAEKVLELATELSDKLAQRLVGLLGDEGALDALLLAWERGYSLEQVDRGIVDATLGVDGIIDEMTPHSARLSLIELPGDPLEGESLGVAYSVEFQLVVAATNVAFTQATEPLPIELVRKKALSLVGGDQADAEELLGINVIGRFLLLSKVGYTPEQIVESIILGRLTTNPLTRTKRECPLLVDLDDKVFIFPAGPTIAICADLFKSLNKDGSVPEQSESDPTTSESAAPADDPDRQRMYEQALDVDQEIIRDGSLISVSLLNDTPEANIMLVIYVVTPVPADETYPACQTDETWAAEATVPVNSSRLDATFVGTATIRAGTCGDNQLVTGQEESTFTLALDLKPQLAEGSLTITSPSLKIIGFEFVLPIAAIAVN